MAYSELIKNFDGIRDYMREFYVYGFKSREEFTKKSARSYDDERRRIESWLGDYMCFRRTSDGKNVFLSIDSRVTHHNPLYKVWKAKSFTDGDITLHFLIFDLLDEPGKAMSLNELTEGIDNKLLCFAEPKIFDSSTVRKKLKEYAEQGLICRERDGRTLLYRRGDTVETDCADALDFFSETAPCGVIGSFLLDKLGAHDEYFAFKHHYITDSLDSEILYELFEAIHAKREVRIETANRRNNRVVSLSAVPLRIYISVQNGRCYLMAYARRSRKITSFRLDNMLSVKPGEVCAGYDGYRAMLEKMSGSIWGVSTFGSGCRTEHVEFTLRYGDGEEYIHKRLEREKRCGRVERIDAHTGFFSADVYDARELIPWIRTFICRIVDIRFSNEALQEQFLHDLEDMYRLYGLNGGDET